MPSAVPIFLKKSDEKQVIYFTWPNLAEVSLAFYTLEINEFDSETKKIRNKKMVFKVIE